jgi:hypothetical protein
MLDPDCSTTLKAKMTTYFYASPQIIKYVCIPETMALENWTLTGVLGSVMSGLVPLS